MVDREITKKRLKQDTLRNLIWQALLWIERHKRPLLIGWLGVLLLLGVGSVYLVFSLRTEQEAEKLLANADAVLRQAGSPVSVEASKFEEPIKAYQGLLERFPRTRSAEEAAMGSRLFLSSEEAAIRLGNLYHQLKRYDEAVAAFEGYLRRHPKGRFAFSAGLGLGYAHEMKDDLKRAAQAYEQAIKMGSRDPLLPEGLFALARVYTALKKKEEAGRLYEKLIKEHPGWAEAANQHLTRLRATKE